MTRDPDLLKNRLSLLRTRGPWTKNTSSRSRLPQVEELNPGDDWEQRGDYTFFKQSASGFDLNRNLLCPFLFGKEIHGSRLVFYDTETTGLSGGAGTCFFLIGFGYASGGRFLVDQFFLKDFPGEKEFLEMIKPWLQKDAVYVSFNGKSFDSHIIRTRYMMNRIDFDFPKQVDLLHPSRRLWRSLIGSCRLKGLEEQILRIHREQDIPGYMVPDVYFNFLKTGSVAELKRVFLHNEQDIRTLANLLSVMEGVGSTAVDVPFDVAQYGRMLIAAGAIEQGIAALLKAYRNGSVSAGAQAGLIYKKRGDFSHAEQMWTRLWAGENHLLSGIELAKYYEHKLKDFKAAVTIVDKMVALTGDTPGVHQELLKRQERLLRKGEKNVRSQKK